jgi:hypothetical protein
MQETRNIKLVAYLRMKGIYPDKVMKISKGKARYGFEISDSEWLDLQKEFDRSEFIRYGQCLDAVTDLAY